MADSPATAAPHACDQEMAPERSMSISSLFDGLQKTGVTVLVCDCIPSPRPLRVETLLVDRQRLPDRLRTSLSDGGLCASSLAT